MAYGWGARIGKPSLEVIQQVDVKFGGVGRGAMGRRLVKDEGTVLAAVLYPKAIGAAAISHKGKP